MKQTKPFLTEERKAHLRGYLSPPGMSLSSEAGLFVIGIGASFVYSMTYLARYIEAYAGLFETDPQIHVRSLRAGAVMPYFSDLFGNAWIGFLLLAVLVFFFAPLHFAFYHRETKSIYVMKRLPNRYLLPTQCLSFSVLCAVVSLLCAVLVLLVSILIYWLATPDACIVGGQWTHFFSQLFL